MSTAAVTLPTATHPQNHVENMARTLEQIFAQCAKDSLEPGDCKIAYETFVQAVWKYPPYEAPDDSCELLANVLCALRKPPMDDLPSFIAGYSRYTRGRYLRFAREQERTAKAQLAQVGKGDMKAISLQLMPVTKASPEHRNDYVKLHGVWGPRLLKIVNACRRLGSEDNGSNQAADGQVPGRQVREGEGSNDARVQEPASSTAALLNVDKDGHRSFPGAVVAGGQGSWTERMNTNTTRASDTNHLIIKLPARGTKSGEGNPPKPHGLESESAQPRASHSAIDRTAEITALCLEYEITCRRIEIIRKAMEIMENEEVLLTGEPFGEFTDEFIESAKDSRRSDEDSTME
ncbi:hypothetical protein LXA43DRAFT_1066492 [Ganoderma leucocontextum]|nr:hypothetical protein LXA43DRAFT_1066492 [Ganoderma leucocontextum]